jgi:glycine hydroxymethyltransferase
MTTRGFGTDEFKTIARLIDKVLRNPESESVIGEVKDQVSELCDAFPLYDFVTA